MNGILKKSASVLLGAVIAAASIFGSIGATAAEKDSQELLIYKKTPTIDGVVSKGEYGPKIEMNSTTAAAWVGDVGNSVTEIYFAWDEDGFYYAGITNDNTPVYRDDKHFWVGVDCIELAVSPGNLITGEGAEGIFFSFGAKEDGSVVAYRHNYGDGFVSNKITAKAKDHVKGQSSYTVEVFIPWELMCFRDNKMDTTGFAPKAGAKIGLLPCVIDAIYDSQGLDGIICAYKMNGTDFKVVDFLTGTLYEESSESDIQIITGGCFGVLSSPMIFILLGVSLVLLKKDKIK